MSTATIDQPLTPEELLELEGDFELIGGFLKKRNVSVNSSEVATLIMRRVGNFVEDHGLGKTYGADLLVRAFPDPFEVRKPDGAFIRWARVPAEGGFCKIPPDLVVEVVSPNDNANDVMRKARLWLSSGVRLVWVAWPEFEVLDVYDEEGAQYKILPGGTVTGGDVLPGFQMPIEQLFRVSRPVTP